MSFQLSRILILSFVITGVILVFLFNPETSFYPPCIFKKITNLQCPGCGSARACYHLLHGNFLIAVNYNLLVTGFLPLIALEGFSRVFKFKDQRGSKLQVIRNHVRPMLVLAIVVIFWIVRNLPFYPFNLLSSDH